MVTSGSGIVRRDAMMFYIKYSLLIYSLLLTVNAEELNQINSTRVSDAFIHGQEINTSRSSWQTYFALDLSYLLTFKSYYQPPPSPHYVQASLGNIDKTVIYVRNGLIASVEHLVTLMGSYLVGRHILTNDSVEISQFLQTLAGKINE